MNAFVDDAAHLRKVALGRRDGTLERIAVAQIDMSASVASATISAMISTNLTRRDG